MRLLVTGAGGMLARAVLAVARARGDEVVALAHEELDVTDEAAVRERFRAERPDAVIQCAAYTAVDDAESDPDAAYLLNRDAARHAARACQKIGAVFVYPSSDYVFDGTASRPYRPADPVNPRNVYGRSKWLGELAAAEAGRSLVVRTSWLYGAGGRHFVDTVTRLAAERDTLDIVDDQLGRPTWTQSLAETIDKLLKVGAVGTFHASDGGVPVSWAGFAREIVRLRGAEARVRPISSSELRRPAVRPAYSVLDLADTEAVIGQPLPDWRASLARFIEGPW